MAARLPRLLLTAPASGGGKTTLTVGLLQVLLDRGVRPASFKCGPDYIDPMFHREVLGVRGGNLDLFFTPPGLVRGFLSEAAPSADVALLEGVMGYYDGIADSDAASTWRVAEATETPAILTLSPKGAFLSLAAQVNGFLTFRGDSMLRGIVLNRCSEPFFQKARPMLERETGLKVYGHIPDRPEFALDSRHLGLVTPDSVSDLRGKIAALANCLAKTLDMDGLLELAGTAPPVAERLPGVRAVTEAPVRIAVARDSAFCFYYRENLELLESLGATLVPFSPLADAELPGNIGGLYLGGGYPELHAGTLAANGAMRDSVREAVAAGLPTVAECGGFLYLQEWLEDGEGRRHPMVGALPGSAANSRGLGRFGYVTVRMERDGLLGAAGEEIRAHEFHYWDSTDNGGDCTAFKAGAERSWPCAQVGDSLYAGFPHLFFPSNPACAERFVRAAALRVGSH